MVFGDDLCCVVVGYSWVFGVWLGLLGLFVLGGGFVGFYFVGFELLY